MNDQDGTDCLSAIREIRRLMINVSKLLLEVDSLIGQEGWEPRAGSTAVSGGSTSINLPRNWLPFHVFRFYRNAEFPSVIPCVAVLLDAEDPKISLNEPHISASILEYDAGTPLPEGWQLTASANWHLYIPGRKDDGSLNIVVPRELWARETTSKRMTSFVIPLMSIPDQLTLKSKVVEPFLRALAQTRQPSRL